MSRPRERYRFDGSGVEPGTNLLSCTSGYQLALGYAEFVAATGLGDEDVLSDPVVATPIPRYRDHEAGGRRWARVAPEALWHPLFWLPDRVWRQRIADGLVEPETVWAVRVCLEMQAAGLYDPTRGWMDVLAAHGIEADDADDTARVLSWLAGGGDADLDGVDLTEHLLGDDSWAAELAAGITPAVQRRAWSEIAAELLGFLEEAERDRGMAVAATRVVLEVASAALLEVAVHDAARAPEFLSQVEDDVYECGEDRQALLAGPLLRVRTWLSAIRDQNKSELKVLDALAAAAASQARPDPGATVAGRADHEGPLARAAHHQDDYRR